MGKIISVSNQKGGVGKTTTSSVMVGELTKRGYKVLGVDFDPQGNLSTSLGANKKGFTMMEVIAKQCTMQDVIQTVGNYSIAPSTITLSMAEQVIKGNNSLNALKDVLNEIEEDFDFIIIDTPPALGFLTLNAFIASNFLIIPATPSRFALSGILELNESVNNIKKQHNPNLYIAGILVTRIKQYTNVGKDLLELTKQLSSDMNIPMYETVIRDSIAVENAVLSSLNLSDFNVPVMEDYKKFIDEFLEKINYKK